MLVLNTKNAWRLHGISGMVLIFVSEYLWWRTSRGGRCRKHECFTSGAGSWRKQPRSVSRQRRLWLQNSLLDRFPVLTPETKATEEQTRA